MRRNRRIAIASVVVLLATGRSALSDYSFDFEKLKADDSASISAAKGRVQRVGSALTLRIGNGHTATFVDADKCDGGSMGGPNCVIHRFAGYDTRMGMFLVLNVYWEWADYDLVSEVTGMDVSIPDEPHFSPDGSQFVVASARECCGENVVQVWNTAAGYSHVEWLHVPRGYGLYAFKNWIDEDHVRLTVTVRASGSLQELPADLIYRNPGWHLEGPPELP